MGPHKRPFTSGYLVMNSNHDHPTRDVRTDACIYLLHCLLQRAEQREPGLLAAMIDGVLGDQKGVASNTPDKEHVDQIFDETLRILRLANDQLKLKQQAST